MCVSHRVRDGDEPPRLHGSLGKMAGIRCRGGRGGDRSEGGMRQERLVPG